MDLAVRLFVNTWLHSLRHNINICTLCHILDSRIICIDFEFGWVWKHGWVKEWGGGADNYVEQKITFICSGTCIVCVFNKCITPQNHWHRLWIFRNLLLLLIRFRIWWWCCTKRIYMYLPFQGWFFFINLFCIVFMMFCMV